MGDHDGEDPGRVSRHLGCHLRQAAGRAASLTFSIDRPTAARLGVSVQAIDDILYDAFGQRQVATLLTQVSQSHVVQELDPRFQLDAGALDHLYVRSTTTQKLIPLAMLVTLRPGVLPVTVNHQGSQPATTLSFNLLV